VDRCEREIMSNRTHLEEDVGIRVMLVDSHEAFLRSMAYLCQRCQELVVVGTASGSVQVLARVRDLRPQVVVIDLNDMLILRRLRAMPCLRGVTPAAGIIALSLLDTGVCRKAALAAGADEFVSKRNLEVELLPAIRRVAQAVRPGRETASYLAAVI